MGNSPKRVTWLNCSGRENNIQRNKGSHRRPQAVEDHPWMRGFTIATLILGAGDVVVGLIDALSNGAQGLLLSIAGFLFAWGANWLLKESDDFKRWSRLTSAQKRWQS
jgi:hypothetical protein